MLYVLDIEQFEMPMNGLAGCDSFVGRRACPHLSCWGQVTGLVSLTCAFVEDSAAMLAAGFIGVHMLCWGSLARLGHLAIEQGLGVAIDAPGRGCTGLGETVTCHKMELAATHN